MKNTCVYDNIKEQFKLIFLGRNREETIQLESALNSVVTLHYEHGRITRDEAKELLQFLEKMCYQHDANKFVTSKDSIDFNFSYCLEKIRSNSKAYEDFKGWIEHEFSDGKETEKRAHEYIELLGVFNPLGIEI